MFTCYKGDEIADSPGRTSSIETNYNCIGVCSNPVKNITLGNQDIHVYSCVCVCV